MKRYGLLLVVIAAACGTPENKDEHVRRFDREAFVSDVLPMLEARCGNPSCHARPERPFSLYVPLRWRAEASRTFLDEQLSEAEKQHDYDVSCALATEAEMPENTLLLRKPLGTEGGLYHGGGAVFARGDAEYALLLRWLETGWEAP